MEYQVTTQDDLSLALLSVKENDTIVMPEAIYEENSHNIIEKAKQLKCAEIYYRWPRMYMSKNPVGIEIRFHPQKANKNR